MGPQKNGFYIPSRTVQICSSVFQAEKYLNTFQRTKDVIVLSVNWQPALVRLDNTAALLRLPRGYNSQAEKVLSFLRDVGFNLKLEECNFFAGKPDCLCPVIWPRCLDITSHRIDDNKRRELSKRIIDLRSFLR